MRELERAYAAHDIWMPYLNTGSLFPMRFRRDPRFLSLLARMHLPESTVGDRATMEGGAR